MSGQGGAAGGQGGAETPSVADLGDGVYAIDTRMSGYRGITSGYLILGERPCLVETGTATSAPVVRDALASLGVGPSDLATVVVTHIHLDHAGGVGDIAGMYPDADVVVHERGARHLVDPDRLMSSARRVFGSLVDDVFGPLRATDATRVRAVGEVGTVDLGGGRRLEAFHAPGHAQHHVGLVDSATGDLYVGDAAGVYIPETGDMRPGTPPPDFDLDVAVDSLRRFRERRPTRLLFSHYGPVEEVDATLDRAEQELRLWVDLVRDARSARLDLDHAIAMVRDRTKDRYIAYTGELKEKFEHLSSTAANIVGINRWLDKVEGRTHELADPSSRQ